MLQNLQNWFTCTFKQPSQSSQSSQSFQIPKIQHSRQLVYQENVIDGVDIVFKNISFSVQIKDPNQSFREKIFCSKQKLTKQILKDISGIFKAGQLTAIMGASGTGKTTLLNILACKIPLNEEGKLYANQMQYTHETFGDFGDYLMQDDILLESLTVRQTLQFAARLKLDLPQDQIKQQVIKIAKSMKLQNILESVVGGGLVKGISGGQMKRVLMAYQLLSDASVFFLDQPTSGLDSLTSYIICTHLKKLCAQKSKTIVMTIHQPNEQIYGLFDELLLLLQGRLIYHDKTYKLTGYLQKNFGLKCPKYTNPVQFIMLNIHHERKQNTQRFHQYFEIYDKQIKTKIQRKIQLKLTNPIEAPQINIQWNKIILALLHRTILITTRNPLFFQAKLLTSIVVGLVLGGVYFNIGQKSYTDNQIWYSLMGQLFFQTVIFLSLSFQPLSLYFAMNRKIIYKQINRRMYFIGAYFIAWNVVQTVQMLIISFLYIVTSYFMAHLSITIEQLAIHYLITILMYSTGSSLGLCLGALAKDAEVVPALVPSIQIPLLLFSGFAKNRSQLPVWIGWFQYLCPSKYAFIAYVQNQVAYKQSNLYQLNFQLTKWEAILLLFCLGIFLRGLTYVILWLKAKKLR